MTSRMDKQGSAELISHELGKSTHTETKKNGRNQGGNVSSSSLSRPSSISCGICTNKLKVKLFISIN